jgi:CHAT domain-containing protein/tetratricopeptide (TPR) repeat protein
MSEEIRGKSLSRSAEVVIALLAGTLLIAIAAGATAPPAGGDFERLRQLVKEGHYAQAEEGARRSLAETEKGAGPDSAAAGSLLDILVQALRQGGKERDPECLELARRALAIKEKVYGPSHPEVAASLNNLATVQRLAGDYEAAKASYERTLAIREASLGPDHPDVAWTLNGLALTYRLLGDYATSRSLFERALAIQEKSLEPDDPDLGSTLSNLALLLKTNGEYTEARPLLERGLTIQERSLGPEHPKVAKTLANLAVVLLRTGDYAGARADLERALAIFEKALGPGHPDVSRTLGNLANLHKEMGDFAGARVLAERSLALDEKNFGPDHLEVAMSLNVLADTLVALGRDADAKPLYERTLAIDVKAFGDDHPRVAADLENLGVALANLGDFARARPLLERAATLFVKVLDPGHPNIAEALVNLGSLREQTGDVEGARALFERALAIFEKTLGPDHLKVASTLGDLARVRFILDEGPATLESALRAETIAREQFRLTARSLAEREALLYERARASGLDAALTVLAATAPGDRPAGAEERVWDGLVRARAMVLDEMAARHHAVVGGEGRDASLAPLVATLETGRGRLARLAVRGPDPDHPERYREQMQQARDEEERAERALAERSAAFRQERSREILGLVETVRALPEGSALVAFVQYNRLRRPAAATPRQPVPSYLAMVLPPGQARPSVVPLGGSRTIDSLVRRWRDQVAAPPRGLPVAGAAAETKYRETAGALRQAIWDPVARHLGTARQVFVVPDGALNLVSLATLPAPKGGYLVESGPLIHYLSAERDLVRDEAPADRGGGLLVLGGPDFDARPGVPAAPPLQVALYRGPTSECSDFRSLRFKPLPGSEAEAGDLERLWRDATAGPRGEILTLVGAGATERAFKTGAPGRRIVHLATHGFFAQDKCPSAPGSTAGAAGAGWRAVTASAASAPAGENPLLLSGLALAGANLRDEKREDGDGEDGVLTAEEIASLDLSGVEWVVLSACETGIGSVEAGEGVLGLRRSFEMAGAGSLIMSLWSVQDTAAREWMHALYSARFAGQSTAAAVRRASLTMIEARRRLHRSTHPFYWGAFVAAGDWR